MISSTSREKAKVPLLAICYLLFFFQLVFSQKAGDNLPLVISLEDRLVNMLGLVVLIFFSPKRISLTFSPSLAKTA
jgi:hypothetical protein